jgi:uncharacterized protein (UPF0276 family)
MEFRAPQHALGVGFPYLPVMTPQLYRCGAVDFVELAPETLCQSRVADGHRRFDIDGDLLDRARESTAGLPMVIHGVELSIGSAAGWNDAYIDLLDRVARTWQFVWHSEHLSFQTVPGPGGGVLEIGVPLPMPPTRETVDLVAPRARFLAERYGVPFLLENAVHYLPDLPADDGMDEMALLDAISGTSGAGVLLDVFNLHCNAVQHGFDPVAALARLRLDRVIEVHIAGGAEREGFLMDSHSERVPEPVWSLLEYVVARAPQLRGIVYELLDETAPGVGEAAIVEDLRRARSIWVGRPRMVA